ncbi:hypothetical protein FQA39_LY17340 [Lamprigera yunnana]|nr:hypothetical protein FQA39_LY17340 [Lamprigera yunnana]
MNKFRKCVVSNCTDKNSTRHRFSNIDYKLILVGTDNTQSECIEVEPNISKSSTSASLLHNIQSTASISKREIVCKESYKSLLIQNMTSSHSVTSNCEETFDVSLLELGNIILNTPQLKPDQISIADNPCIDNAICRIDNNYFERPLTKLAMGYVSGYIIDCPFCKTHSSRFHKREIVCKESYKSLLIQNMTSSHSVTSNCEETFDVSLLELGNIILNTPQLKPDQISIADNPCIDNAICRIDNNYFERPLTKLAMGYVSGYIIDCPFCKTHSSRFHKREIVCKESYKSLLIQNMTSSHSVTSNCEETFDVSLLELGNIILNTPQLKPDQISIADNPCIDNAICRIDNNYFERPLTKLAMGYVSGYIIDCPFCKTHSSRFHKS